MSAGRIYVVEMHTGRRWEPTVGVGLTRERARIALKNWRQRNAGATFRLALYSIMRELHR